MENALARRAQSSNESKIKKALLPGFPTHLEDVLYSTACRQLYMRIFLQRWKLISRCDCGLGRGPRSGVAAGRCATDGRPGRAPAVSAVPPCPGRRSRSRPRSPLPPVTCAGSRSRALCYMPPSYKLERVRARNVPEAGRSQRARPRPLTNRARMLHPPLIRRQAA